MVNTIQLPIVHTFVLLHSVSVDSMLITDNVSYTKILRRLFAVGLLVAFIFISAKPSFENFLSEKVITDTSEVPSEELLSPALTICMEIVGS